MPQKVFVNQDQMATFTCPECGKAKRMDVSRFCSQEKEIRLKYKCQCGNAYSVILERRRYVRKPVNLTGNVIYERKRYAMKVADLSRYGMKIKMIDSRIPFQISRDDVLEVEFNLDDANHTLVNKEVLVQTVLPSGVGVKFKSTDHYDQFGKYLLFHFG